MWILEHGQIIAITKKWNFRGPSKYRRPLVACRESKAIRSPYCLNKGACFTSLPQQKQTKKPRVICKW